MSESILETEATPPRPAAGEPGNQGRVIAMAAGDLFQTTQRETRSLLQQAKGDRFEAMKLGLARLRKENHLTQADVKRLQTLLDALRAASDKPIETDEVPERIRATYHTIVADSRSSGVAVAIASLANSLVIPSEPTDVGGTLAFTLARTRVEGAGAVLVGAMIGAAVGGEIGGPVGAGAGAVIGGVVGGVLGECDIQAE